MSMACLEDILSFHVIAKLEGDAVTLFLTRIVRLFSFGFLAVVLVLYLAQSGFSMNAIGILFTLTLFGDAILSLFITAHADVYGRGRMLVISAILGLITSFLFAINSNFIMLLIIGIIGIISPSGNEIGPFMAIEMACLSQITETADRTRILAWYNLAGSFSTAFGAFVCGWIIHIIQYLGFPVLFSYQIPMYIYAIFQGLLIYMFYNLSDKIEVPEDYAVIKNVDPINLFFGLHKSKNIVLHLAFLFSLDSFAGSFVLQSFIANWFEETYHTDPSKLGIILFCCNIVAGISALLAAKIADFIGLVLTMVVTHLPSNVLLILVPLMPNESLAMLMIILRFSISQMDVPTRNAYVMNVVDSNERSSASGVTNVSRSLGAALGPYFAGLLFVYPEYRNYCFYIAGVLKIVYDILILYGFNNTDIEISHFAKKGNDKNINEKSRLLDKKSLNV